MSLRRRGSGPPCADRAAAGARSRQPPSGVWGISVLIGDRSRVVLRATSW